ncbi:MAG: hypothetical protein M3130_05745 [Actinomycetota bacterium]|nr:hypothetical protein [Actinomycetota bacterium]
MTEEEVARLLAQVRAVEPMPGEVSDRLEATLGRLIGERPIDPGRTATVVPLRRRLAPRLLAAAVLVVIVGGVGVVLNLQHGSKPAQGSAAGSNRGQSAYGQAPSQAGSAGPALSRAHFAADAARLLAGQAAVRKAPGPLADSSPTAPAGACRSPAGLSAHDQVLPIRLDGRRAQLVVRPSGANRLVQAWDCPGTTVLEHAVLPR